MPSRASAAAADTQGGAAPSLAPPDAPEPAEPGPPTDPAPGPRARRRRPGLIVKGVAPAAASESASPAGDGGALPEYPIQFGKVQPPALRDETLARDRLLEWLSIKIHRRVVLLVAEAGYGKTTLLADFTRRTRVRMLWFRLDRGDRDWVGFLAHLVAAVRVHAPEFGAGTRGLLRETATAAPSLETVLDTFLRELGGVPAEASALVLDDFHMVDDSPEVRQIIRELLSRRTEGWAASLQLVRAALNDRDPSQVRAFISSLSGAEGHLYDYLAEEVIGDLPDDLQQFLMRTSLLETIDLVLAPVAAGVSVDEARTFIEQAERRGILGKGGLSSTPAARAHPLVRDFLRARLRRSVGDQGMREIHVAVAEAAEVSDWRASSHHYVAAGEVGRARRVLAASIETVVATGAFAAADDVMGSLPGGRLGGPAELILRSRLAQQRGASAESLLYAEEALEKDRNSPVVLLNLVTARYLVGDVVGATEASHRLETTGRTPYVEMGRAARRVMETWLDGRLDVAATDLESLAEVLRRRSEHHYLGVACLNLAMIRTASGDPDAALASADEAIDLLSKTSAGVELVSARLARAFALSLLGHIDDVRNEINRAIKITSPGQAVELAFEGGVIEAHFGDPAEAWPLFGRIHEAPLPESDDAEQLGMARSLLRLRAEDFDGARTEVTALRRGKPSSSVAFEARRMLIQGMVMVREDSAGALAAIRSGTALATHQGAHLWALYGELLGALSDKEQDPSPALHRVHAALPAVVSMLAEATLERIDELSAPALDIVRREAAARPWRWRAGARHALATGSNVGRHQAATLLGEIGEVDDIVRLRGASRSLRSVTIAQLALSLARRLAPRVFVEDLGRVRIHVGGRRIEGVDTRRKVLALLCLLLSKPRFASTREEVAEALWPDQDPGSALNSLNQTVYFLRRVFEPAYRDETSPMYVGQDGETIWLDPDLVDSRSRRCGELVRTPGDPTPHGALELAKEYRGRFALDFAYEDWASGFRESLHAAYLRILERAIQMDLDSGHFNRGTFLAERATEVDPEADEIQAALVRLYRLSGAYAAAAEQYGRYSQTMRELGVEPRPLAEV